MEPVRAQQIRSLIEAGHWWAAAAAAQRRFDDPDTLVLAARAWAELGLRTLAGATLDRLCAAFPAGAAHRDVLALRERIATLPDDRVAPSRLRARVDAAAQGLRGRGVELGDAVERWAHAATRAEVFLASDGNAVRRRIGGGLELVGDHRAASRALIEPHAAALRQSPAPITIEGLDPPWLAIDMHRATAGRGYTPGIRVVQADPVELLDGCSLADEAELARLIEDDRVEWFVGRAAPAQLASAMAAEPGVHHEGPVVPLATLRTRLGPALGAAVKAVSVKRSAEHAACLKTIRERDLAVAPAERLARLAGADPLRPRRVALIAGRFTTVLRPMIEDLAASFRRVGCETTIITEPGDHRRLTAHAYARAFASFDPDLIVAANHTRDDMDRLLSERVMPAGVPWVTWVQDAMPHLLRPEAGRAIGAIDLAIGHITGPMRASFGYREDRSISAPMVASTAKFAPGRVDARLARDLACEIAAFTNHSETPAQMRARLIDEVSSTPGAAALVERIADAALALATEPIERVQHWQRCAAILDACAPHAEPDTRENLLQNVAMRLYDRACRHRALEWARDAADRNGWRLAIYGAGWDAHPTLAPHARGTVEHGDPICTAYAAARVTLDATTLTTLHQRVAECALAGGLPAVLATGSALTHARSALKRRVAAELAPLATPAPGPPGTVALPAYRSPAGERFARLGSIVNGRSYPYLIVEPGATQVGTAPGLIDADEAVGLIELGVWSRDSLEAVVRRAGDGAWRDAQRARLRSYINERCTHDGLVARILGHYTRAAGGQTAAA